MENQKVVVITGASTGIGYSLSRQLLEKGYRVYGSVRKKEDADRLQEELPKDFTPLLFDVTDYAAIEKAGKLVEKECPEGIQCLVNNAGIVVGGPLLYIKMTDFNRQFKVNVIGLLKVTQVFAPLLGAREGHTLPPGRILQMSSVSGKLGMPFVGPYAASKHALEGLSESLRRELMLWGIDVIVIGPGAIKTPIWNKGAEEIGSFSKTEYARSLEIFNNKLIRNTLKTAWEVEDLAREMVKIIQSKKPRTRYTFMAKKLTNFILPRLLPPRLIDRALAKMLGFSKK